MNIELTFTPWMLLPLLLTVVCVWATIGAERDDYPFIWFSVVHLDGNDAAGEVPAMNTQAMNEREKLETWETRMGLDLRTIERALLLDCWQAAKADSAAEIADLTQKLEDARKDAERYRWLTCNAYVGIAPYPTPHEVWCLRLPNPANCHNLDAAIDAAMKEQK